MTWTVVCPILSALAVTAMSLIAVRAVLLPLALGLFDRRL